MPPVLVVGIAAVIGATSAALTWLGLRPEPRVQVGARPVPVDVLRAVLSVRRHQASAPELRAAAITAERNGYASLAAALRDEAAVLAAAQRFAEVYRSPLAGVPDEAWTLYVKRSRVARPSAVSADNRLGCFALTARELADVGWLTGARKARLNDRLCWVGEWAEGRGAESFLADDAEQYEALTALTQLHARALEQRFEDLLEREVEGQPATRSGLLGVARRAGLGGLRGWCEDPAQRKRFPETTAAYARLNGIF